MQSSEVARQIPYFLFVLSLFTAYGILVRRGNIKGKNILWAGVGTGALAVTAALVYIWPDYQRGMSLPILLIHPVLMALVTVYCVGITYRAQRVQTIATYIIGDTKILVISCPPSSIPDADALLLPGNTRLRMVGGLIGLIGFAAGAEADKEMAKSGPVGIGKVVEGGPGRLPVGRIYQVAVQEPLKDVTAPVLKRSMESAVLAARKGGAESVAVPLGALRGLPATRTMEIMAEAVLKQRKAFGEIVFVTLDARSAALADDVVRKLVEGAKPEATNPRR
jgi:O-acetyl-ADP-ribose deacetylase (regulator of RNase III)